jgi:hypothetical protein
MKMMNKEKKIQKISDILNKHELWDEMAKAIGMTITDRDDWWFHEIEETILEGLEEVCAPPTCINCGDRPVEVEGQPCSKECKDEYVADWLTEKC